MKDAPGKINRLIGLIRHAERRVRRFQQLYFFKRVQCHGKYFTWHLAGNIT